MRNRLALLAIAMTGIITSTRAVAQDTVSFATEDGGRVYADLYGSGERAVVLAHGGQFTKESWAPQALTLATAGFRVMAIDFRGYGQSIAGPWRGNADAGYRFDVLAAVRYLRKAGAKTVALVGASFGGDAVSEAAIDSAPDEIDRIVLLAHGGYAPAERIKARKLFIVTRDDKNAAGPRLPRIQRQFQTTPGPKELVVLDGSAHAQFVFETDQGPRLMREILRFLTEP